MSLASEISAGNHFLTRRALLVALLACLSLAQAGAQEMRFASWPEVIATITCDRIRDEVGGLAVLGPIYVEEKHFSSRAVTNAFEARAIRERCFHDGRRLHRHYAYRPYYPYRYGQPYYYSPGQFLLPDPPTEHQLEPW